MLSRAKSRMVRSELAEVCILSTFYLAQVKFYHQSMPSWNTRYVDTQLRDNLPVEFRQRLEQFHRRLKTFLFRCRLRRIATFCLINCIVYAYLFTSLLTIWQCVLRVNCTYSRSTGARTAQEQRTQETASDVTTTWRHHRKPAGVYVTSSAAYHGLSASQQQQQQRTETRWCCRCVTWRDDRSPQRVHCCRTHC